MVGQFLVGGTVEGPQPFRVRKSFGAELRYVPFRQQRRAPLLAFDADTIVGGWI